MPRAVVTSEPVPGQIGLIEEIEKKQRYRVVSFAEFLFLIVWPFDVAFREGIHPQSKLLVPDAATLRELADLYAKDWSVRGEDFPVEDAFLVMEDELDVSLPRD